MGGSAPRDSRLDLDDLGDVIDRARPLDLDVLEGEDGPTWAERLESAGITRRLRRHRVPLAGAAVVALLAGGGWAVRVRTAPPPPETQVRATVVDAAPDGSLQFVDRSQLYVGSGSVIVTPSDPRDVITVHGVVGPGVRASSVTSAAAGPGTPTALSVVTGCDDPRSVDPTPDDYLLRVSSTDPYGRTVDGLLPLPSTLAEQLAETTGATCVQQLLAEEVTTTRVTVRPDPAHRLLRVRIGLSNASGQDLTIFGTGSMGATVATTSDPVSLPAGSTAQVDVTATVLDCTAPRLDQVTTPYAGDLHVARQVGGISFFAALANSVGRTGGELVATWPRAQQTEIEQALDRMCSGSPGVAVRVLDAGPAPPAVRDALGLGGPGDGVALRMHLEVRTSGTHVDLTDGALLPSEVRATGPPQLGSASADVVRGRAVLTVDWATPCDGAPGPPEAQLAVTTHGSTYPVRVDLGQRPLALAYLAACPALTPGDLDSLGWPPMS